MNKLIFEEQNLKNAEKPSSIIFSSRKKKKIALKKKELTKELNYLCTLFKVDESEKVVVTNSVLYFFEFSIFGILATRFCMILTAHVTVNASCAKAKPSPLSETLETL